MKGLTPAEIEKVLKVASQSKRNHAMLLIAFRHGARASEVCDLLIKDVDMKAGKIIIRRKKGSLTTEQPIADHAGKPLLAERRVLKAWLEEREQWKDASPFVFCSQKGGKLSRVQFFRIFQSIAEEAGLPADRRHPHCLKHALGFALVEAGVPVLEIKAALGHRSVASSAIYAVASEEKVSRSVQSALITLF